MSKVIKNMSRAKEVKIEGYDKPFKFDLSDKRVNNKALHLVLYIKGIADKQAKIIEEANKIEDLLERKVFISDKELEILTELKNMINDLFDFPITDAMFGTGCTPEVYRYTELFEQLHPIFEEVVKEQQEQIKNFKKQYGLDRIIKPNEEDTQKFFAEA